MSTLLLLKTGPGEPAFNMALDEALMTEMPRLNVPALRFYSWTLPAATFGYFQRFSDVEKLTSLRPLVRRPTGGGIVPHDADWTYSMAFPAGHEWYSVAAIESYRRVHELIRLAFHALGLTTQLAPEALRAGPGQCFMGYEHYDLLHRGRKIAGAAQRRTREGLLIQGSVQAPDSRLNRDRWEQSFCMAAEEGHRMRCELQSPDDRLLKVANTLVATKFSQEGYNRKR